MSSRVTPRLTKRQKNACLELLTLLGEACEYFDDKTAPLWLRTANGMQIFDDVPLRDLPKELRRQINATDAATEDILRHYHLETTQDYRMLSELDLLRLQNLHLKITESLTKLLLPDQ